MKSYYRVMLGRKSAHAAQCFQEGFIGTDFEIPYDLTGKLPEEWREFNREFIPIYQKQRPEKNKISAGLACGALWTVSKGIAVGDLVLCPDGDRHYQVGEVTSEYRFVPGGVLPHRRTVRWIGKAINYDDLSESLANSAGSVGTVSNITRYHDELERLIGGVSAAPTIVSTDPAIEEPASFVLEKQLEEFLVANWANTDLGKKYDIFQENGELVGQQYPTDTGPLDILAVSKDKKSLLVVELKKGRASDAVVGQILRYMGFVQDELAEPGQTVRGVIITGETDPRIQRALKMTTNVEFYTYHVQFALRKA